MIFEYPLNEIMRLCLRLEHWFAQLTENMSSKTQAETELAIEALLQIVNLIDRPDLKSKLIYTLAQLRVSLNAWQRQPHVDTERVQEMAHELDRTMTVICGHPERLGETLRHQWFLNLLRQQLLVPGGLCGFNTPAFQVWLKHSAQERKKELESWYNEISVGQLAADLLLKVARNNAHNTQLNASQGFHQQALDSKVNYQLLRVEVLSPQTVFPEISVGRHRLSVRFIEFDLQQRAIQTNENVPFQLSCGML